MSGGLATLPSETGCRGCVTTKGTASELSGKAQGSQELRDPRGGGRAQGRGVVDRRGSGAGVQRGRAPPLLGRRFPAGPGEGSQSRGPGGVSFREFGPRLRGPRRQQRCRGSAPRDGKGGELGTRRESREQTTLQVRRKAASEGGARGQG